MAKNKEGKVAFLVYYDWESLFNSLDNNEQAGELIKALFAFAKRGEIAEFTGALKMAFVFMSQQLERDADKWEEICSQRSEAGRKGGAPKGNKNASKQPKQPFGCLNNQNQPKQPKQADTDTEYDTDNISMKKAKKVRFGEYNHVLLTDAEYEKLCNDYGCDVANKYIKKVDEYCEQSGKRYKNYNLAIRNTFMSRDNVIPQSKKRDIFSLPDEELTEQEKIIKRLTC